MSSKDAKQPKKGETNTANDDWLDKAILGLLRQGLSREDIVASLAPMVKKKKAKPQTDAEEAATPAS